MDIHYATTNAAKVKSLERELQQYGITVIPHALDLSEPRSSDVETIARVKVQTAFAQIQLPTVALDAGFYVHSLNGFPRAFVNFALETVGIEGILKLVDGKERSCEFRDCLAYLDAREPEPVCFLSRVEGTIANEPRGTMQPHLWSKLSLIFIPQGSDLTLAEMSYDAYHAWRKVAREATSAQGQFGRWYVNKPRN
jgi:XTP/dITP diphosphohydrolase